MWKIKNPLQILLFSIPLVVLLLFVTRIIISKSKIYQDMSQISKQNGISDISDFESCAKAGNPVMESYPRRCRADGQTFVEDVSSEIEQKSDLIKVYNPRPNDNIDSPLTVVGIARGYWFFEASFPVYLYDGNGSVIAEGSATAQRDWMTEDFVPYEATLTFDSPSTNIGELVLMKDNPSGMPENDDQISIPVYFE